MNCWKDTEVADAWADANGSKSNPWGDRWRTAIVNPVIMFTASQLVKSGPACTPEELFYKGLKEQVEQLTDRNSTRNQMKELSIWYKELFDNSCPATQSLKDLTVLDLGCGEGYLGRLLTYLGAEYYGVDVSASLIQKANERRHNRQNKMEFLTMDLDGEGFSSEELDKFIKRQHIGLIIITATIEHLKNPRPMLRWVSSLLQMHQSKALLFTLNPEYFIDIKEGAVPDN